jgi:hypothetical protein
LTNDGQVYNGTVHIPIYKTDKRIDQVAVQNTWYTALDTTANVRLIDIATNMITADETIEIRITIDGVTMSGIGVSQTAGTWYHWFNAPTNADCLIGGTLESQAYRAFLLEGRSIKVEFRKTTAAGLNHLFCQVRYEVFT